MVTQTAYRRSFPGRRSASGGDGEGLSDWLWSQHAAARAPHDLQWCFWSGRVWPVWIAGILWMVRIKSILLCIEYPDYRFCFQSYCLCSAGATIASPHATYHLCAFPTPASCSSRSCSPWTLCLAWNCLAITSEASSLTLLILKPSKHWTVKAALLVQIHVSVCIFMTCCCRHFENHQWLHWAYIRGLTH